MIRSQHHATNRDSTPQTILERPCLRLVAVKPSDVQAFATEKNRAMAAESVRSLMRFVSAVFASALHRNRVSQGEPHPIDALGALPNDHRPQPLTVPRRAGMIDVWESQIALKALLIPAPSLLIVT